MAIPSDLQKMKNPEKARLLAGFFKTRKGEYGEGDIFLGITVPEQRKVALRYWKEISLKEIAELLQSSIHEYRLTALLVLVEKFRKADDKERKQIFDFYISNLDRVNN